MSVEAMYNLEPSELSVIQAMYPRTLITYVSVLILKLSLLTNKVITSHLLA